MQNFYLLLLFIRSSLVGALVVSKIYRLVKIEIEELPLYGNSTVVLFFRRQLVENVFSKMLGECAL